jgi:predicted RNA-binding protein with PUA-like domain
VASKSTSKSTSTNKSATPSVARGEEATRLDAEGDGGRGYWLLKSEPGSFSFDDLMNAPGRTTYWDGVRNYQARNFMRDSMRVGDGVLFYHSSTDEPAVAGIAEVVRAGYPDHTAFDRGDPHYDAKSRAESPTWYMVDVRAVERFDEPVTLTELRRTPGLEGMALLQRGSRLSVQPVRAAEWKIVRALGGAGRGKR